MYVFNGLSLVLCGGGGVGGNFLLISYLDGDVICFCIVSLSALQPNIEELEASAGDRRREFQPQEPAGEK